MLAFLHNIYFSFEARVCVHACVYAWLHSRQVQWQLSVTLSHKQSALSTLIKTSQLYTCFLTQKQVCKKKQKKHPASSLGFNHVQDLILVKGTYNTWEHNQLYSFQMYLVSPCY